MILFEQELCSEKDMIIVELSSNCRRQPTVGGADSSVSPVTHIISPDHSPTLSVYSICPHGCRIALLSFLPILHTACIIMTSSAGTVHALNDSIFLYSSLVLFACILTALSEWMIQPFILRDMICLRSRVWQQSSFPYYLQ